MLKPVDDGARLRYGCGIEKATFGVHGTVQSMQEMSPISIPFEHKSQASYLYSGLPCLGNCNQAVPTPMNHGPQSGAIRLRQACPRVQRTHHCIHRTYETCEVLSTGTCGRYISGGVHPAVNLVSEVPAYACHTHAGNKQSPSQSTGDERFSEGFWIRIAGEICCAVVQTQNHATCV